MREGEETKDQKRIEDICVYQFSAYIITKEL